MAKAAGWRVNYTRVEPKGEARTDWKVNLKQKMENWWVQTTRGRSVGGTMDANMINNNVNEAACFADRLPSDSFSIPYCCCFN